MNLPKIADALRTIADAMDEEAAATVSAAPVPAPTPTPDPTPEPVTQPAPEPVTQPAPEQEIMDPQVFTTELQKMAREVGSGVLHQMMPDVYTRFADGVQKYSAIRPENRGAVLQYVRDRIEAVKQGAG